MSPTQTQTDDESSTEAGQRPGGDDGTRPPAVPNVLFGALNERPEAVSPLGWRPHREASTPYFRDALPPQALGALRKAAEATEPTAAFHLRHEWLGRIETVHSDYFEARLYTRKNRAEELAEIWLEEISPTDLANVRPGAVFYWTIGYRDEPWGQRRNVSTFHFRRVPSLDEGEQERAAAAAAELEAWARGD